MLISPATLRSGAIALVLTVALGAHASARNMTKIYDDLLYPEGPVFADGALLFADMRMGQVMRYESGRVIPIYADDNCGPTSLARLPSGHWLTSCHLSHEIVFFDPGSPAHLIAREHLRRPNDMSAGSAGVYVSESGEFDPAAPISGQIWLVSGTGQKRVVATGLHYANGVAVTKDGRSLLVCEHLARRVWRYVIKPDGNLGARTLAFDVGAHLAGKPEPLTGPDGIEAAPDGSFYVAINGRGLVMHVDTTGALLETFETSGYPFTTNVALVLGGLYAVGNRTEPNRSGALFYIALPARE